MSAIPFPSMEFFQTLQRSMSANPGCTETLEPNESYCALVIGDRVFVLEFDGRSCAAVVQGGNLLDLDFYLRGSESAWREAAVGAGPGASARSLEALVADGDLEIASENAGEAQGRDALGILQAFFDQARGLELA